MNANLPDESKSVYERAAEMVSLMTPEEKISQLTNSSVGISHLGIRQYDWWNEALHGVARAGTATVYPQAIGLASMWNERLLYTIADEISTEARAKYNEAMRQEKYDRYFGLTFWSPNINIFRDPRWGRGQETYGEDPYLTSRLGVAYIKGMQGESAHLKTAACAKHFAAHSGPETGRTWFDCRVQKKDLFETYLPAFEAAVKEARVESVMGAYNALDGVPCCCNRRLLTELLRESWGFEGHVVSDCGAIINIYKDHHYTDAPEAAAAAALKAGCDLNCGNAYLALTDSYEQDEVLDSDLDRALIRLLSTKIKLGMFDSETEYDKIGMDAVACKAHKQTALQASRESLVLLKNDGLLPLDKGKIKSVAVIGPNADSKAVLLGNYNGLPTQYSTVYSAFCESFGAENVCLAKGSEVCAGENDNLYAEAVAVAGRCDVTVLCLGLDATFEGEGGDAYNPYSGGDRPGIELPDVQLKLLERIKKVSDKIIVVTFCGGIFSVPEDGISALIHAWYPGEYGGKALAELVTGVFSPSGRLPVTIYKSTGDLPEFSDYSMKDRTYRYFTGKAAYNFGFGLSYTDFSYSDTVLEKLSDGSVRISVTITNTGKTDSAEVAELYKSETGAKNQPIKSLIRFKKIFLKAGESQSVSFVLSGEDFSHITDSGEKEIISCDRFRLFFDNEGKRGLK